MESEDEGDVFMDLSNMKETRDLEVYTVDTLQIMHSRKRDTLSIKLQWNLGTKDTMGLIVLSLVERLSLSRR